MSACSNLQICETEGKKKGKAKRKGEKKTEIQEGRKRKLRGRRGRGREGGRKTGSYPVARGINRSDGTAKWS